MRRPCSSGIQTTPSLAVVADRIVPAAAPPEVPAAHDVALATLDPHERAVIVADALEADVAAVEFARPLGASEAAPAHALADEATALALRCTVAHVAATAVRPHTRVAVARAVVAERIALRRRIHIASR